MRVQLANKHDIPNWLALAAEVEHLFGPMVDIKLLVMYTTVFRPKAIVAISGLATLLVFVLCVTGYWWMPLILPMGM